MRKLQRSISKWLNWKTGVAVLAVLLIAALVLQFTVGWGQIVRWMFGTAGPSGGQTCLPTCETDDGKFLLISNNGMYTFAGQKIVAWITVPADWGSWELGIFDGDSGKDNAGNIRMVGGNWDDTTTEAIYTLYADPAKLGGAQCPAQLCPAIQSWAGQSMPNNAWFNVTLGQNPAALSPSGRYYIYRLEVTQPIQSYGGNAFKLRSTGWLSTGKADLVNAEIAFVGQMANMNDLRLLYPNFQSFTNAGPCKYNGDWQWYFYLPSETKSLEIWDGDFDRGSYDRSALDTDDPNTEGRPPWASADVKDEGIGGTYMGLNGVGNPSDNNHFAPARIGEPVWYEIINPNGFPIFQNGNPGNPNEPSGTEEWERYLLTSDTGQFPVPTAADSACERIQAGMYHWDIHGLDLHNLVFIRTDYEVCPAGECPPPPWCDTECACPRTIGYWKNNVKKVLIENKTKGVQETRQSLERALNIVAMVSPLYRSGINVAAPAPISNPARLTDQEAHAILQKAAGNTMLDRALQQNLATWMNLASGKVGYNVTVSFDVAGGHYEGTIMDALLYAQDIILYHRDDPVLLERAKDIADMINNGELNVDPEDRACDQYSNVIPPAKQPPKHNDMPKQPKRPEPPAPVVGCDAPRTNQYNVESPTNNPFYGIKFEYQSGSEIRDGGFDEFRFILPADVVNNMTAIQLEAKAGEVVGQGTLQGCQFNTLSPCEQTMESSGFLFTFQGAVDNGDGTMMLIFHVRNMNGYGLSHVTFGLPDGVVPSGPSGSYESSVCP